MSQLLNVEKKTTYQNWEISTKVWMWIVKNCALVPLNLVIFSHYVWVPSNQYLFMKDIVHLRSVIVVGRYRRHLQR